MILTVSMDDPVERADLGPFDFRPGHKVVIVGRKPGDRPFLTAKYIEVRLQYWPILSNQIVLEVTMNDWQMVMEMFREGHNLPKFTPKTTGTESAMRSM